MNLVPAVWKRSRRVLFYASLVICPMAAVRSWRRAAVAKRSRHPLFRWVAVAACVASVAYGLTAVYSAPARADAYTLTYPGGDIVESVDVPGVSPATMSNFLTTIYPQSVGLSSNPSLSALFQATWQKYSSENQQLGVPDPPTFSGGSISASSDGTGGSDVSADIPASDVSFKVPGWAQPIVAGLAGFAVGVVVFGLCYLIATGLSIAALTTGPADALVLNAAGGAICAGLGSAAWGGVAYVVGNALAGKPYTAAVFWHSVLAALISGLAGGALGYLGGLFGWSIREIWRYVATAVVNALTFLKAWIPSTWNSFVQSVKNLWNKVREEVERWLPNIQSGAGVSAPGGTGTVSGASAHCLDAYGANGVNLIPARPGQAAAINACNGNMSQYWEYYPQNGQVMIYGLCLDTGGGPSPMGSTLVDLGSCTGGSSQHWTQNGAALVNQATGECLDDPGSNTSPGTRLQIWGCNNTAAQQWALPTGPGPYYNNIGISDDSNPGAANFDGDGYSFSAENLLSSGVSPGSTVSADGFAFTWPPINSAGTLDDYQAHSQRVPVGIDDGSSSLGVLGASTNGSTSGTLTINYSDGSSSTATVSLPDWCSGGSGVAITTTYRNNPGGRQSITCGVYATSVPIDSSRDVESVTLPPSSSPQMHVFAFAGSGASAPPGGGGGSLSGGPCDIYAYYNTPCAAAYSTTRALYSGYGGSLYQVRRASDGTTANIGLLSTGGDVNAAAQDSFCSGTPCTITEIFDQSPDGNNLTIAPAGGAAGPDRGANAASLPITIGGHKAYGLDVEPGVGYRDNSTTGIATNGNPEGMYMVASGTHVNSGCCFDFGNAETNSNDNGAGHMDAVNLSTTCWVSPCAGSGPWVQADLENGIWMSSGGSNTSNLGNATPFVTAMLQNNGQNTFAVEGGDSTTGGLSTWWNGSLPPAYIPMHQEGAIILGTGGDNSNSDVGSWFEGVMTSGYPSMTASNAVQANIVAAGYAGNTTPALPPVPNNSTEDLTPSAAGQAVVHSAGATGCGAAGFSSVYTVDKNNGDLQETYLPCMGQSWNTQDLSMKYGTPPVKAGTQPVSIVHCGWTSVYTVDAGSGDLQETYLSAIGNSWGTQDLSRNYGTPPTNVTPTAVEHTQGASGSSPGCGFTSVYTVDSGPNGNGGDLQETYLPNAGFPGDPWTTQDLSAKYGGPAVGGGTSPVAVVHCGWTSVYFVNTASELEEAYLPEITYPWSFQSLSHNYGTPAVAANTSPTAVVHSAGDTGGACGWTSVYTVDAGSGNGGDLEETYLPDEGFPGDNWNVQDLTQHYGVPQVVFGSSPVALVHMGYTSVYYINTVPDLEEAYLPAIYGPWSSQDLGQYGSPSAAQTPIVLLHPDANGNLDWTSVFTIVGGDGGHLFETYLSNVGFPGDPWQVQDLSARFGTPPAT